jgi:hypothetical protein
MIHEFLSLSRYTMLEKILYLRKIAVRAIAQSVIRWLATTAVRLQTRV